MKINNFRGEVTDIYAKKEALEQMYFLPCELTPICEHLHRVHCFMLKNLQVPILDVGLRRNELHCWAGRKGNAIVLFTPQNVIVLEIKLLFSDTLIQKIQFFDNENV